MLTNTFLTIAALSSGVTALSVSVTGSQDCTACYQQSDCYHHGCDGASTDCCTTCSGNSDLCGFCTTSSPSPSPSPRRGCGAVERRKHAFDRRDGSDIGLHRRDSIAWTDGNIGKAAPFDPRKPIAWTRGTLSKSFGEAGNAGFKGTTYTFTNVDLSKLPPGSAGTYYLVNLPGNGAEGVTATASNQHGSFKAYADAQGCAGWSGKQGRRGKCARRIRVRSMATTTSPVRWTSSRPTCTADRPRRMGVNTRSRTSPRRSPVAPRRATGAATFSECTRPLPRRGAPRELRSGKCPRDLLRRNARPRQPSDQ